MTNRERRIINIIAICVFAITGALVYFLDNYYKAKNRKDIEMEIKKEIPSQYPEYDNIAKNKDFKKVMIAENFQDKAPLHKLKGLKKEYRIKGEFDSVFLYLDVFIDKNIALRQYDDIYFSINKVGGHLIKNSLPVPPSESSRFLYNMKAISYKKTINDSKIIEDFRFLDLLNENITIWLAISSNRGGKIINEASMYYKCAESSDCSIEEVKNQN